MLDLFCWLIWWHGLSGIMPGPLFPPSIFICFWSYLRDALNKHCSKFLSQDNWQLFLSCILSPEVLHPHTYLAVAICNQWGQLLKPTTNEMGTMITKISHICRVEIENNGKGGKRMRINNDERERIRKKWNLSSQSVTQSKCLRSKCHQDKMSPDR